MKNKFKVRNFDFVKEIIESYEDEEILNDFLEEFEKDKEIKYKDYFNFCYNYIDDMSETYYINCNWNDEFEEEELNLPSLLFKSFIVYLSKLS